jgi:hypothetical protein
LVSLNPRFKFLIEVVSIPEKHGVVDKRDQEANTIEFSFLTRTSRIKIYLYLILIRKEQKFKKNSVNHSMVVY